MMPMNTVAWTWDAAESLSPSGLHCSHSPTPMGTSAPQRAQPWVGSAGESSGTQSVGRRSR